MTCPSGARWRATVSCSRSRAVRALAELAWSEARRGRGRCGSVLFVPAGRALLRGVRYTCRRFASTITAGRRILATCRNYSARNNNNSNDNENNNGKNKGWLRPSGTTIQINTRHDPARSAARRASWSGEKSLAYLFLRLLARGRARGGRAYPRRAASVSSAPDPTRLRLQRGVLPRGRSAEAAGEHLYRRLGHHGGRCHRARGARHELVHLQLRKQPHVGVGLHPSRQQLPPAAGRRRAARRRRLRLKKAVLVRHTRNAAQTSVIVVVVVVVVVHAGVQGAAFGRRWHAAVAGAPARKQRGERQLVVGVEGGLAVVLLLEDGRVRWKSCSVATPERAHHGLRGRDVGGRHRARRQRGGAHRRQWRRATAGAPAGAGAVAVVLHFGEGGRVALVVVVGDRRLTVRTVLRLQMGRLVGERAQVVAARVPVPLERSQSRGRRRVQPLVAERRGKRRRGGGRRAQGERLQLQAAERQSVRTQGGRQGRRRRGSARTCPGRRRLHRVRLRGCRCGRARRLLLSRVQGAASPPRARARCARVWASVVAARRRLALVGSEEGAAAAGVCCSSAAAAQVGPSHTGADAAVHGVAAAARAVARSRALRMTPTRRRSATGQSHAPVCVAPRGTQAPLRPPPLGRAPLSK
eukprot:scaffold241_cov229-Prasinococcus_capsulatus_cf.AAC.17